MNNDDKLIEDVSKEVINYVLKADKTHEEVAKDIIALVRESIVDGHVLVPDGIYEQMKIESAQFRVDNPNHYRT